MKYRHAETPGTSSPSEITLGLYERYTVDDDGVFEIPDDELDAATRRRLEEAGHEPVDDDRDVQGTDSDDADSGEAAEADGDADESGDDPEQTELEEGVDDEYADMDRSELYEVYKEEGGPESWNDTDADFLRRSLRVYDEHGTFPTLQDDSGED